MLLCCIRFSSVQIEAQFDMLSGVHHEVTQGGGSGKYNLTGTLEITTGDGT